MEGDTQVGKRGKRKLVEEQVKKEERKRTARERAVGKMREEIVEKIRKTRKIIENMEAGELT